MKFIEFLEIYLKNQFDFDLRQEDKENIKRDIEGIKKILEIEDDPVPLIIAEASMPMKEGKRKGIVVLFENPYKNAEIVDEKGKPVKETDPSLAILNLLGLWIDKTNPHFTGAAILSPTTVKELISPERENNIN